MSGARSAQPSSFRAGGFQIVARRKSVGGGSRGRRDAFTGNGGSLGPKVWSEACRGSELSCGHTAGPGCVRHHFSTRGLAIQDPLRESAGSPGAKGPRNCPEARIHGASRVQRVRFRVPHDDYPLLDSQLEKLGLGRATSWPAANHCVLVSIESVASHATRNFRYPLRNSRRSTARLSWHVVRDVGTTGKVDRFQGCPSAVRRIQRPLVCAGLDDALSTAAPGPCEIYTRPSPMVPPSTSAPTCPLYHRPPP